MVSLKTLYIAAAMASVLPSAAMAADTFAVDPAHTQTVFTINHLGYSMITEAFMT